MEKIINWFKQQNIFKPYYNNEDDCIGIYIFNIWFDFRYWYKFDDNNEELFLKNEIEDIINGIQKSNKKRKNKISIPTYTQVPIYSTIVNYMDLWSGFRKSLMFLGAFVSGFILRGFI